MSINMNDRGNQIVAILIVAVLIICAWYVGRKQALVSVLESADSSFTAETYAPDNTEEAGTSGKQWTESAPSVIGGGESLTVEDQPAGMEVKISSLVLSEMGWAGVRDNEGRVLGAGRFDAGSFENVTVPLLRATVAGDSYQVLLYVDDGDREFDLKKDILITGPNGGVAGTNFKAL